MLCHHAYLHGKSLTTIFSVVFCCDFALHIREATDSHRVTLYI